MIIKPTIKFINHASFIISDGITSILTDPWYQGSIFNNAWNLLYENADEDISNILNDINYIWISHEHPDHFSINFFLKFSKKIIESNIKILFQETIDKRVISFLKKNNFEVVEIIDNQVFFLNDKFKIKISKFGFYDSSLILEINNFKIFNINDCAMRTNNEISAFNKIHGNCDILLSQFSYAAWKGGVEKKNNRIQASQEKINSIINQINILKPKFFIPIASLVWFSHKDNFYMNDSVNKIHKLKELISSDFCKTIIMKPYEEQQIYNLFQNNNSFLFWSKKYDQIDYNNSNTYIQTYNFENVNSNLNIYKQKIFQENSKLFMFFIKIFSFNFFFPSINIKLIDLNQIIIFNFFDDLKISKNINYDISMHSESLIFIFKNTYGFDTLTVNGLFEIDSKSGFQKVVYNFGIGNLNNLGFKFNLKLLLNYKLIMYIIKTYIKSRSIT